MRLGGEVGHTGTRHRAWQDQRLVGQSGKTRQEAGRTGSGHNEEVVPALQDHLQPRRQPLLAGRSESSLRRRVLSCHPRRTLNYFKQIVKSRLSTSTMATTVVPRILACGKDSCRLGTLLGATPTLPEIAIIVITGRWSIGSPGMTHGGITRMPWFNWLLSYYSEVAVKASCGLSTIFGYRRRYGLWITVASSLGTTRTSRLGSL